MWTPGVMLWTGLCQLESQYTYSGQGLPQSIFLRWNTKSTSSNTPQCPHPTESVHGELNAWLKEYVRLSPRNILNLSLIRQECVDCVHETHDPPPPVVSCGSLHLKTSAPSQRCHTHGRTSCPVRQRGYPSTWYKGQCWCSFVRHVPHQKPPAEVHLSQSWINQTQTFSVPHSWRPLMHSYKYFPSWPWIPALIVVCGA